MSDPDPVRRKSLAAFLVDIAEQVEYQQDAMKGDDLAVALLNEVQNKLRDCGIIVGMESRLKKAI